MTDKERYEAAMEENHRLREELKDWKESFSTINEDYRKISKLHIKEQQKNEELMMINTHLTNEALKQAAVIMLQADQIRKLKISTAHALSRWAQATKIWYKLKGYSGLAARYEKVHKHFFEVYNKLKLTKKPAVD
ncbi:MAG: hypothetical protein KBT02_13475 [Treponema sp.]|nr:hypothetical protein [Candidatus Treponema caballi]